MGPLGQVSLGLDGTPAWRNYIWPSAYLTLIVFLPEKLPFSLPHLCFSPSLALVVHHSHLPLVDPSWALSPP